LVCAIFGGKIEHVIYFSIRIPKKCAQNICYFNHLF
jgi:hypothetical protein